jgi:hypothetical protein
MNKSGEEDYSQRGTVIFDEISDMSLEQADFSNDSTDVRSH